MAGLDSYGTPLLAPFAPFIPEDQKDAITKSPLPEMTTRPKSIPNINKVRSKAVKDDK
jgi:spore germination protein KA